MARDWTKLPPIDLRDSATWQNHKKGATTRGQQDTMTFAERWAQLMQAEISKGNSVVGVAGKLEKETEVQGLAGTQFQYALKLLVKCWVHGEELRQFYNLRQGGAQGAAANTRPGVVFNPQSFTI